MKILICLAISLLAITAYTQNFEYTYEQSLLYFQEGITSIAGNYIFAPANIIFDTATNTQVSLPFGNCISMASSIKLDIWCLGYNPTSEQKYSVNLLNSENLATETVYQADITNYQATDIQISDIYVIPYTYSYTTVKGVIQFNLLASNPFNYKKKKFDCQGFTLNVTQDNPFTPFYFTGLGWIYAMANGNNEDYVWEHCDGKTKSVYTSLGSTTNLIYGFNQSQVFVSVFTKNDGSMHMAAFSVDRQGHFTFGSDKKIFSFQQVTETNFIASYQGHKNKTMFGLFVADTKLKFFELRTFQTKVRLDDYQVDGIPGTSNAAFTYGQQGGQFVQHVKSHLFEYVVGMLPPITLNDGTIVNITQAGVFYATPTDTEIQFRPLAWESMYQDPSNPNNVFIMSMPGAENSLSRKCSMYGVLTTQGVIETTFKSCPVAKYGKKFKIHDVQLNSEQLLVVAYTDYQNNLYVTQSDEVLGPYFMATNFSSTAVSINVETGLGYFMGVSTDATFVSGSFGINTGVVNLNSDPIQGGKLNYVYKLNEQLVLMSATTSGTTVFTVFNQTSNSILYKFNSQVPMPESKTVPYFALNVDPVNNPTKIFDGIVVVLTTYGYPYLVNPSGAFQQLSLNVILDHLNVYPVGQDSILVSGTHGYFAKGQTVTITNWGDNVAQVEDEY